MSNSRKAIQELKSLMAKFGFMNEELLSFKTADDIILQTEKLEKGNRIYKIDDKYELSSVENGTYRLKENFEVEIKDDVIEAVKEVFLDAVLEDGTKIKVEGDSLVEGAKVVVVTEDSEIPAPDGVHVLAENGTKVETKDGKIVKVEEMVADGEMPEMEAPEVEVEVPLAPSLAMEKEMMEMVKDFVKKMSEKIGSMESQMSDLQSQFQSFKSEPAGKKIADGKTDFNKQNNVEFVDPRIATIVALRNKK